MENRAVLANFSTKVRGDYVPLGQMAAIMASTLDWAVSLHFASELSFLCASSAVDLFLFCLLPHPFCSGLLLLASCYLFIHLPVSLPLSFSALLILFAGASHSLLYLPPFLRWSYFWYSSLPLILGHNILKEGLIMLAWPCPTLVSDSAQQLLMWSVCEWWKLLHLLFKALRMGSVGASSQDFTLSRSRNQSIVEDKAMPLPICSSSSQIP